MTNISHYKTLVFDCDGVILDSNKVKTQAFYRAALPYGEAAAKALIDYHVANGGISRYKKFDYFLNEIVRSDRSIELDLETLLSNYAAEVFSGLLNCDVAEGLQQLRERTPNTRWLVVSGGDQKELRQVFAERCLAKLFNGGIFGSPDTKDEILARELAKANIQQPALFLGDSKYDYQAARTAGLDFIFLSRWTEVQAWEEWSHQNTIRHISCINSLLSSL